MNNMRKAFGKVVVSLRNKEGLSQECLAWDLGSDRKYLSDIECGKRNFSLSFAERVANKFNIRLSELFSLMEEEMNGEGI